MFPHGLLLVPYDPVTAVLVAVVVVVVVARDLGVVFHVVVLSLGLG